MNARPKMRTFAALVSIAMLGVPQSAIPMPSETTPPSTAAQSLTREEMEFLMGEIHRNHGDHATLSYLSQKEMSETEGKVGPAAVGVAVVVSGAIATGASALNDVRQGNSINWQNATSNGVAAAWATGSAALASLSGVGLVGQAIVGGVMGGASLQGCSACHSSR